MIWSAIVWVVIAPNAIVAVVEKQTAQVDSVSGATITSDTIKVAIDANLTATKAQSILIPYREVWGCERIKILSQPLCLHKC